MTCEQPRGLVATDVWLSRGGRAVLTGATLVVPPGTVTALIAPSGAGKSTLLRCLNRLLEPDRGTITLDGQDVRGLPPRELRRRVGLVSQTPVMLEGTVRENLAYGLPAALTDDDAAGALTAAGLDPAFAARDAEALSGGERARVALARAIVRRPDALLLDEPTAALDADVARQVAATLRTLAGDGLAVCLAIHDVPFARDVADRVVGLDGLPVDADEGPGDVASTDAGSPDRPAGGDDHAGLVGDVGGPGTDDGPPA